MNPDRIITVCASCNRASCWHGVSKCVGYKTAMLGGQSRSYLDSMGLEHPHHYSDSNLTKMGITED